MTLSPRSTKPRSRHTLTTHTAAAANSSHSVRVVQLAQPNAHIILYYYSQLACSSSIVNSTPSAGRRAVAAENRKGKYCSTSTPPYSPPRDVIITPHTLPIYPDPNVAPPALANGRFNTTPRPRSQPQDRASMMLYCKQTGH